MMYLALTYDHRLLDGREAVTFLVKVGELDSRMMLTLGLTASFLVQVKQYIEDPARMLLG